MVAPAPMDRPVGPAEVHNGGEAISWQQAMAAGLRRAEVGYLVRRGAWEQVRRGRYAHVDTVTRRVKAALLSTGSRAVVSHGSAAALLGLDLLRDPNDAMSILTVSPGTRGHRDLPGVHVHRARLPARHVTEVEGHPVTTVARTLIDLTRSLSLRDGVVAMDAALHAGRVHLEQLEQVVADCRGWPWIRRAAAAVELTDPATESALESLSRLFFRDHDIPAPQTQVVLRSERQFVARTDFWWESRRVAGEADGLGKYTELTDLYEEKRRQERIEALGIRVVRWTWNDISRSGPARITAARLRAALANNPPLPTW